MGKQAEELIKKFGGNYSFSDLQRSRQDLGLAKIQYTFPKSVGSCSFSDLEALSKKGDKDAKKAIKLLLQTKRLNEKPGRN